MKLPPEERAEVLARVARAVTEASLDYLKDAIQMGMLTTEEYRAQYKGKYATASGTDSFLEYLVCCMESRETGEDVIFTTMNEAMLADRKALEERFGVQIMRPSEVVAELEKKK